MVFFFLSSLSLQFLFCILQTLFELLWILRISEVGCKQLRLWALINKVSICISDSGAVAANIRPQLHRQCTVEGGIYLQGLVPPCEKMDDPFLLCFKSFISMVPCSFYSGRSFPKPKKSNFAHVIKKFLFLRKSNYWFNRGSWLD